MFNQSISPEQRLNKAVMDIMAQEKYIALAGIVMIGTREIDDTVPTACTNGRDEKYGRAFVESLSDAELRFLVLHENYHKLYQHLTTWKHLYNEDPRLANMACDYVINLKIFDDNTDGFAIMPSAGCIDSKYAGMDSAQVFLELKENGKGEGGEEGEEGEGGGAGGGGMDDHDWDGAQELGAQEKQELARDIDEAVRQGALVAGQMGTGGDRELAELLEPQVDWREVLREFISTTCAGNDYSTWQRPNRRYVSAGMYMPSGISEQIGELVIAIDTSGSIGVRELSAFLSEVKGICDAVHPSCVRLLYWDTQVCGDEKYELHELDDLTKSTKPVGGGGTDVACVPEHITKEGISPQAVIVLTDGYLWGDWGQWASPVLWCVMDNKQAKPDVGVTVHIKGRDL